MPVVIVDAVRTPRGIARDTGALHPVAPVDLLAQTLKALIARSAVDPASIGDVIAGSVTQTGEQGGNIGKTAVAVAGLPRTVPAVTINRYCASGLSAVAWAALQAEANGVVAVGGGVESMSRVAMLSDAAPLYTDKAVMKAAGFLPLPLVADLVATEEGITRADCDAYAALSQARAAAARDAGAFDRSMVPVRDGAGTVLLARDETIRPGATADKLAGLRTTFEAGGPLDQMLLKTRPGLSAIEHVHTAGNAPAMADGAAAVLVMREDVARAAGLTPRARIRAHVEAGGEGAMSGDIDVTRKALSRAGLGIGDIDLFEIRDGFAATTLHLVRALGLDIERFNVNGSSIALGHPMGATGAMLVSTLLDALEDRGGTLGLCALSGAMGVGSAMVIERV